MKDEVNPEIGINQEEKKAAAVLLEAREKLKPMRTVEFFENATIVLSSDSSIEEITTLAHKIPYLAVDVRDKWQSENANANANGLAISSISRVEDLHDDSLESHMALLDEEKCRLVNSVPPDMQLEFAREFSKMARTITEIIARRIAEKDCVIAEKVQTHALWGLVTKMYFSIRKADMSLQVLAHMSQRKRTMQSNISSETRRAAQACIPKNYVCAGALLSQVLPDLVRTKQKLPLDLKKIQKGAKGRGQGPQKAAGAWEAWIDVGFTKRTSKRLATSDVLTWMQEKIKDPDSTTTPPPFPGVMSDEVTGTQPALEALLTCIADGLNEDSTPHSPPKNRVERGQIIPESDHRPKRIVDLCLDNPGQFKLLLFDHALNLLLEVKPLLRQKESLESLHHQCFEQTLGHLAKFVYQGLNLFGIGASTFATGITGNLAYISVYKLELIMKPADLDGNVAKLQLHESDRLPLMTKPCFEKWTDHFLRTIKKNDKKKKWEEEIKKLRLELYGDGVVKENDGGASGENIPLGIWVLWDLMKKRRQDLFGPNYKEIFSLDSENQLLGSGSFSLIFSFHGGKAVLKVGIDPSSAHIENEINILQKLHRKREDIDELALPVLKDILELPIVLGGVKTTSKGLVLSPKGNGILSFCRDVRNQGMFLDRIIPTLVEALEFIHNNKILHNDVSPKNIIVQGYEHNVRAFLVDFGCASEEGTKVSGFVGTPTYSHVDVFHQYPGKEWTPQKKYDYFSLGLSLSWLVLPPGENWNMGRFPLSLSSIQVKEELEVLISNRITMAKSLVQGSGCKIETQIIWMRCLNYEQVTTTTGRKRKRAR